MAQIEEWATMTCCKCGHQIQYIKGVVKVRCAYCGLAQPPKEVRQTRDV